METQQDLSAEINAMGDAYARALKDGAPAETQPRLDYAPYRSSILRHPTKSLHHADPETIELYSPAFGHQDVHALESDLTIQHNGEPQGERIIVAGKVLDGDGRPVAGQLVEIWQANASGRYIHKRDQHPAPLDPNFTGVGRCITGPDGSYRFTTIKPGAYPWKNHVNAWRPAHIHFSHVRHGVHPADRHPDVLPRRPALPAGPHLPVHRGPGRPRPAGGHLRPRPHRARMGARLQLGHRPHRLQADLDRKRGARRSRRRGIT